MVLVKVYAKDVLVEVGMALEALAALDGLDRPDGLTSATRIGLGVDGLRAEAVDAVERYEKALRDSLPRFPHGRRASIEVEAPPEEVY